MGGMVLMLGVLLWLASRNPVRNVDKDRIVAK